MRVKIQGDREGKYSNKESCTRLVKYLHHKYEECFFLLTNY